MPGEPIAFGPYLLDASRAQLTRDGKPVTIGQRGLAVLAALLEANGLTVSKSELMARGWPETIVEEGNLTVQIAALRKALGDRPDGGEWIITVPRVGYRLPRPPTGPAATPTSAPRAPSLAVLPFRNISSDQEQDYFADGVIDDIITALSRFRSFAVVARGTSFTYKNRDVEPAQVARDLGVRYVLEGSIRRAGDRIRITAQLVDAISGEHLWGDSFDGSFGDVFDFQDRITEAVATSVEPEIQLAETERSRRERPGSTDAYDLYLRALAHIQAESANDNAQAIELLRRGLAIEPNDRLLLAHMAWALSHRIAMGWRTTAADVEECIAVARHGVAHADGDPLLLAHCGLALIEVAKDYDLGMALLRTAVEANPNNLLVVTAAGVGHIHCGSVAEALVLMERAGRLSPRSPFAHITLCGMAHVHMILGNYEEALDYATRALAINLDYDPTYWMLIAANAHLGNMDQAKRLLDHFRRISPAVTIASLRAGQPAKDPTRLAAIFEGMRMAGLPES